MVAEQLGRWDTVGIDCVAMNVNDVVCVGAEPLAMVDYLAVDRADPEVAGAIGTGLARGAELAGIEIVGGELAQLGELINGLDLAGACFGIVALDSLVTGASIEPGDPVIGLPSSGLHSNGYTLARSALAEHPRRRRAPRAARSATSCSSRPRSTSSRSSSCCAPSSTSAASPTSPRAASDNLLRLEAEVGYEIDDPLPVPEIFTLIQELGDVSDEEMHEVFNMGCGFCVVVAADDEDAALGLLRAHYPEAKRIGRASADAGRVVARA